MICTRQGDLHRCHRCLYCTSKKGEERQYLRKIRSIQYVKMAPHLSKAQHVEIELMLHSKLFKDTEIAEIVCCSRRSVSNLKDNLRCFGSTKSPPNKGGRARSITPVIVHALCKFLLAKPMLYLDESVSSS